MAVSSPGSSPPSEGPERRGFWAELIDAVTERTFFLVAGVLVIQLAFVLSYVGAFHHPSPHRIPVAVVAPAQVATHVVEELNAIGSEPVAATAVGSEAAGRTLLREGSTSGVLVVDPSSTTDTLLVAGGGGAATVTALREVFTRAEATQHRTVKVVDVVPDQPGDVRGLSGFYLVIGWLVGGYLVAALLGVAKGSRPATTRRAVIRSIVLVPYAVLSGLGGAIIVGPVLGALTGHLVPLWWLGALLVFSAGAVTMAFEALFGIIGIGLTVVLFVVLGNPSAGGAFASPLLPPFWRAISEALPNGAGVEAVRRIVYFGSHEVWGNLLVIAIYALAGSAVAVVSAVVRDRRRAGPAELR